MKRLLFFFLLLVVSTSGKAGSADSRGSTEGQRGLELAVAGTKTPPPPNPLPAPFPPTLAWCCSDLRIAMDRCWKRTKRRRNFTMENQNSQISRVSNGRKGPLCCLNTAKILQAHATSWLKPRREPPITSRHVSLRWPTDATPRTCLRNVWYFTSKWVSFDRMPCLTAVNHEMSAHTSARLPWGLCQRPCSCLIIHRLWSCLTFSSLCCSFKEGTCLYLQMKPGLDAARF